MSQQESQELTAELLGEHTRQLVDKIRSSMASAGELKSIAEKIETDLKFQITRYALSLKTTKFKKEELEAFFGQPYYMYPVPKRDGQGLLTGEVRKDAWYLIIPRWIDAQFGWLVSQSQSFNVFEINRYMDWLGELPAEVKKQIGWKDSPNLKLSGDLLVGPREALVQAMQKYKPFVKRLDEKGIVINPSRSFELLAALVKDGILPFTPRPVAGEDLIDPPRIVAGDDGKGFERRDYQIEAWKTFLQYSNVGIFFPPSTGKTWMGMWAMASLKGPHLVVVPSRVIQDQWRARLKIHTSLKENEDYIVATYQAAIRQYADGLKTKTDTIPWMLVIVDEAHHLPADWFSKLALIKKKYGLGLSATPFREDGREDYIFAFTGFPVGLSWEHFRKIGLIRKPTAHVYLVKGVDNKLGRIKELLKEDKRTVIFCDGIELGKSIAARFKIPHLWGDTKEDRIKLIDEAFSQPPYAIVGSRVLDEGVSLPAIQRIIEVDWLGASRRQELQRYTRLLHSKQEEEGESDILMTEDEYIRDHDRFYSLFDKGFAVRVHANEIEEERIAKRLRSGETPQAAVKAVRASRIIEASPPEAPGETQLSQPGQVSGTLQLPGIQKLMSQMSGPQRKFFEYLVKNDGTWFKAQNPVFWAALGYSNYQSLAATVGPGKLVKKGLVEKGKIDGQIAYRTNMTSR